MGRGLVEVSSSPGQSLDPSLPHCCSWKHRPFSNPEMEQLISDNLPRFNLALSIHLRPGQKGPADAGNWRGVCTGRSGQGARGQGGAQQGAKPNLNGGITPSKVSAGVQDWQVTNYRKL